MSVGGQGSDRLKKTARGGGIVNGVSGLDDARLAQLLTDREVVLELGNQHFVVAMF